MTARVLARPGKPSQIHLSWSEDPQRTLTITWWTPAGRGLAHVEFGLVADPARTKVDARSTRSPGSRGSLHRAVLRDLEPGREYLYRVSGDHGAEPPFSPWYTTRTAPASPDAVVRAAFVSDTGLSHRRDGSTSAQPEIIRALESARPHVLLGGGDYAYADHDPRFRDHADAIDRWFDDFEPVLARTPFMAQFGNHDVEVGERLADWAPRLAHPKGSPSGRSYAFDLGAAHIVGLWAPGRAPGEHELEWLEADLESEPARRATWRIVFQHAPLVASGACHPARPEVASLIQRFDDLGIDLHLSAHDQNYERTHPMRHGHATAPKSQEGHVSRYIAGNGVLCAKISPSGKLSDRSGDFSTFSGPADATIAARDDAHHHWGMLEISRRELRLRIEGVSRDGLSSAAIEEVVLVAAR